MSLVGCTFRHEDELHAAIFFLRAFLLRSRTGASGNARCVDALFAQELSGEIGSRIGEFGCSWFPWVRIAGNHQLGVRGIFQAPRNVGEPALAGIVSTRGARLVVVAITYLGGLWRWWRLLHIDGRRRIRIASSAVVDRTFHGVTASLQARGVKLGFRSVTRYMTVRGAVAVGQRIIVRIAGGSRNSGSLTRHNRAAVGGARNCRWSVGPRFYLHVRGASCCSASAVVDLNVYRVASFIESVGGKTSIGTRPFHSPTRRGVAVGEVVVVRIAGGYVYGHAVT